MLRTTPPVCCQPNRPVSVVLLDRSGLLCGSAPRMDLDGSNEASVAQLTTPRKIRQNSTIDKTIKYYREVISSERSSIAQINRSTVVCIPSAESLSCGRNVRKVRKRNVRLRRKLRRIRIGRRILSRPVARFKYPCNEEGDSTRTARPASKTKTASRRKA